MSDAPGPSLAGAAAAALHRLRPDRHDLAVALMILAATPVAAATAARIAAIVASSHAASIEHRIAPRLAAAAAARALAAEADRVRPLLARPTITALAARLVRVLPDGANVAMLSIDAEGVVAVEIDCLDPEQLADAIAADPLLSRLHRVGQRPAAVEGVRVALSTPRP